MKSIDVILERLQDSEWHSLDEMRRCSSLSEDNVKKIISFLAKYEFISFNTHKMEAKIKIAGLRFLELSPE